VHGNGDKVAEESAAVASRHCRTKIIEKKRGATMLKDCSDETHSLK
jgi:hypothetical protein